MNDGYGILLYPRTFHMKYGARTCLYDAPTILLPVPTMSLYLPTLLRRRTAACCLARAGAPYHHPAALPDLRWIAAGRTAVLVLPARIVRARRLPRCYRAFVSTARFGGTAPPRLVGARRHGALRRTADSSWRRRRRTRALGRSGGARAPAGRPPPIFAARALLRRCYRAKKRFHVAFRPCGHGCPCTPRRRPPHVPARPRPPACLPACSRTALCRVPPAWPPCLSPAPGLPMYIPAAHTSSCCTSSSSFLLRLPISICTIYPLYM